MRSLEFDPAAFEDLAWWVEQDRAQALSGIASGAILAVKAEASEVRSQHCHRRRRNERSVTSAVADKGPREPWFLEEQRILKNKRLDWESQIRMATGGGRIERAVTSAVAKKGRKSPIFGGQ